MLVKVNVHAGARREKFSEKKPGLFDIVVREKAERNEANDHVRVLIARHYKVSVKAVRIISGARSPRKTLDVAP